MSRTVRIEVEIDPDYEEEEFSSWEAEDAAGMVADDKSPDDTKVEFLDPDSGWEVKRIFFVSTKEVLDTLGVDTTLEQVEVDYQGNITVKLLGAEAEQRSLEYTMDEVQHALNRTDDAIDGRPTVRSIVLDIIGE